MSQAKKKASKPETTVTKPAGRKRSAPPSKRVNPRYRPPISDLETEFALFVMRGTGNIDETQVERIAYAARMCGLTEEQGRRTYGRAHVQEFMRAHKRREAEVLVEMEVRSLRKKGIGKAEVLAHLDRLASIPPERTRNSISGQVHAAVAAATILGLNIAPRDPDKLFAGRTPEELRAFANTGKFPKTIEGETLQ